MIKPLTIGQLAKRAGVNIETLRYYEREKLIASPPRRISGYRQYPLEMVSEILFIRQAKELGFSLKDVAELLKLRSDPHRTAADVKRKAQAKISEINDKIRALQAISDELATLSSSCPGHGPTSQCPIMAALETKKLETV